MPDFKTSGLAKLHRGLARSSWTTRQWETSDQACKGSLNSQRQTFPCQQDLCWERPPFKQFSCCTSAAVSEKDWWAFERKWDVGGSEEMQLCEGEMEKDWAKSPKAWRQSVIGNYKKLDGFVCWRGERGGKNTLVDLKLFADTGYATLVVLSICQSDGILPFRRQTWNIDRRSICPLISSCRMSEIWPYKWCIMHYSSSGPPNLSPTSMRGPGIVGSLDNRNKKGSTTQYPDV